MKPWTLGNRDVFPEVFVIALAGLLSASVFAAGVAQRRFIPAVAGFAVAVSLLSYPFFAGLTSKGQQLFWFGPLLGAAALVICRTSRAPRAVADGGQGR